jgi:predicted secreted protein
MRKFVILIVCAVSMAAVYAGDLANFINLGFSADGSRFAFGQYGRTDGDYRAYADIFCVDVAKNDFVPGGRFSTAPSTSTAGKDGRSVFHDLQARAGDFLGKQSILAAQQGRSLYVQAENEPNLKKITFRDFETGTEYTVTTYVLAEGSGSKVRSSFYLVAEMTDQTGNKTVKTVGTPSLKRSGVSDYLVRRIVTDGTGKSLVFVVEKKLYEKNGDSARYMVETCRL